MNLSFPSVLLAALMMVSSSSDALSTAAPKKVIVSGAGGQTGQSLFRQMLAIPDEFQPLGLVRSEESKAALIESGDIPEDSVVVVDVTDVDAVKSITTGKDIDAFCICTSAKPAPTGETDEATGGPVFGFPNGDPEVVDYMGQKNQINACPKGTHVVICSTMGGTDPDQMLNKLGRVANEDGTTSGGNIVKWKRTAEVYLIDQKDLSYTIVHPGGLVNEPGSEREIVVGVDDSQDGTESRTIPRADVASVMLNAVRYPAKYAGRSFDIRAKPVGDGTPTTNFESLLDPLDGKNSDYSLGETM